MPTSPLDDATLDRLRAVFGAAGGDGPVVLTDAAGRPLFTLAGPPAEAEPAADRGDDYLLRLAEHFEGLPEDPSADFGFPGTIAERLRAAAAGERHETTATQILAEAARREREDGGEGGAS